MSSVDRSGWQDTQKVNFCKECYIKEEKIRNQFLDKWEQEEREEALREGRPIPNISVELPEVDPRQRATAQKPTAFVPKTFANDAEAEEHLRSQLSRNLWKRMNPGYVESKNIPQSVGKATFVYDSSELEPISREHFRKRDGFTNYVEASARYKLLMQKKKGDK